jgi:hypothetical protein
MILYANGDSHTAAAEAVNPHCFAEDDSDLYMLGRRPHPANLAVSWGQQLAKLINAEFYCDAESAASNARIMRTTRDWIHKNYNRLDRTVMVIQWSTWEREEWLYEGQYWQVNASGIDHVPVALQDRYKQFVSSVNWGRCAEQAHREIWQFHQELNKKNIQHVFFNGNSNFDSMPNHFNWSGCYMNPYDAKITYSNLLKTAGFSTVNPQSWHFGPSAHSFWANYVLQYIKQNNLVNTHALPID